MVYFESIGARLLHCHRPDSDIYDSVLVFDSLECLEAFLTMIELNECQTGKLNVVCSCPEKQWEKSKKWHCDTVVSLSCWLENPVMECPNNACPIGIHVPKGYMCGDSFTLEGFIEWLKTG